MSMIKDILLKWFVCVCERLKWHSLSNLYFWKVPIHRNFTELGYTLPLLIRLFDYNHVFSIFIKQVFISSNWTIREISIRMGFVIMKFGMHKLYAWLPWQMFIGCWLSYSHSYNTTGLISHVSIAWFQMGKLVTIKTQED